MGEIKTVEAAHLAQLNAKNDAVSDAVAKFTSGTLFEAPAPAAPEAQAPEPEAPAPAPAAPEAPAPAPAAPEAPAPAPAAPEAPAAPAPDPRFEQLLEMNRQLVQAQLAQRQQPKAPSVDPVQAEIAEAVKNRDFATLAKHGLTAQEWTDATMAELTDDPKEKELYELKKQYRELQQWKAQQEDQQRQQQERARQEHVQRIENETKTVIREELESDPELKILTRLAGGVDAVYSVIEKHVLETQRLYGRPQWLDAKEAAKVVLQNKGSEIGQLLEVAKEHPSYRQYFAASAAADVPQPAGHQSPNPAPAVAGNQVRGSAAVAAQDTMDARKANVMRVIEAFARQK